MIGRVCVCVSEEGAEGGGRGLNGVFLFLSIISSILNLLLPRPSPHRRSDTGPGVHS